MESGKEPARHCLLYKFDKKSTEAAACHNVCQVYGKDAVVESMCRRWFRKFRKGDRSCKEIGLLGVDDQHTLKNTILTKP
ncbi:UNVERIFIED_CONTAM: hypothetical protein NCL1_26817 [Trichonephila clavipes]